MSVCKASPSSPTCSSASMHQPLHEVFDPDVVGSAPSENIRNVCILAHVDHGKTTLSDHLIASNGLISKRSAGHLKFLDSRGDEQRRLITMKASCITLSFRPQFPLFTTMCPASRHPSGTTADHPGNRGCSGLGSGWTDVEEDSNSSCGGGGGGGGGIESFPGDLIERYWINLIDSPGHVDFSTEVSAATRLCDGALILIDAIEGVCPQTQQVVLRAFAEGSKLLLVINKIDRLFTELCLSPTEVYTHLCTILEHVNAMTEQLLVEEAMHATTLKTVEATHDSSSSQHQFEIDDEIEAEMQFHPEKGNVIFCSSLHGWAFDLQAFAQTLAKKLELPSKALPKLVSALWGDFYLNPKTKTISRKPSTSSSKPMIVQLVLEQLWKVYDCTLHHYDEAKIQKVLQGLNLTSLVAPDHLTRSGLERQHDNCSPALSSDPVVVLKSIMSAWLPLTTNVLSVIVKKLPSPVDAAPKRLMKLLPGFYRHMHRRPADGMLAERATQDFVSVLAKETLLATDDDLTLDNDVRVKDSVFEALLRCRRTEDAPIVIYAARFLGADIAGLRLTGDKLSANERMSNFVALSRIFSGRVSVGTELYVCGTQFVQQRGLVASPDERVRSPNAHVIVTRMFYLLGQDLVETASVSAGSVVALCLQRVVHEGERSGTYSSSTGYEDVLAWVMSLKDPHLKRQALRRGVNRGADHGLSCIDRCITLSNSLTCPPFKTPYSEISSAIVRVCLEPKDVKDTIALLTGLATLYKADPGVDVDVLDTGEVTLGCSGEVHLEKCVNDLQNLYAQVELNVSAPVVAVRESLSHVPSTMRSSSEHPSGQPSPAIQPMHLSTPFPPWAIERDKQQPHQLTPMKQPNSPLPTSLGCALQVDGNKRSTAVVGVTANNAYAFRIRALPLPGAVLEWLDENSNELQSIFSQQGVYRSSTAQGSFFTASPSAPEATAARDSVTEPQDASPDAFVSTLHSVREEIQRLWTRSWDSDEEGRDRQVQSATCQVHAPRESFSCLAEPNMPGDLIGVSVSRGSRTLLFCAAASSTASGCHGFPSDTSSPPDSSCASSLGVPVVALRRILPAVLSGFELASQAGPLCEEPVINVGFCIEAVAAIDPTVDKLQNAEAGGDSASSDASSEVNDTDRGTATSSQPYGPVSGQVISCIKDCCRRSLLQRGRTRIYEAMHRLELHCEQEVLGRVYSVLSKRRSQVISEVLREGTSLFAIVAFIPVAESFGLALDLRNRASGQISLHVQFSHWQMLDEDPFPFESMTEEELEDEGESGFPSNISRRIICTIRKRKGLATDEKVVEVATKQRTLTRKK